MMKMSSLTISNWPRWKLPCWRMFRPSISDGSSAFRRSRKVARCASTWSTSGRSASLMAPRRCSRVSKMRSARAMASSIHCCTSAGWIGSGAKSGNSLAAGKGEMQFGDAAAGLRHVTQIGRQFFAVAGMFARCQQALLFDKAVEIGRRHRPAVALVFDKGMHDGDRAFGIAFDQFDAAKHRGRIGEARDLGQEPADLDRGIDAGFQFPVQLEDIVVIHERGAAAVLVVDGADTFRFLDQPVRELAGRPEFELHAAFFDGQGFAQDCAATAR